MIETIQAWFDLAGGMFQALLAQQEFGALFIGTFGAIAITQAIKMAVIQWAPTNGGRGLWYLVTLVSGMLVTWLNWRTSLGISWGIVAGGLLAPSLYLIGTRTLYRFYPEAEERISATPKRRVADPTDQAGA